jgi:hypothetical protein
MVNWWSGPLIFHAGPFFDPDGDEHEGSQWQARIFGESDWFYTHYSPSELTTHQVADPTEFLSGVKYEWQVGYEDSGNTGFAWSDQAEFVFR